MPWHSQFRNLPADLKNDTHILYTPRLSSPAILRCIISKTQRISVSGAPHLFRGKFPLATNYLSLRPVEGGRGPGELAVARQIARHGLLAYLADASP
jgi:hypothetical protein